MNTQMFFMVGGIFAILFILLVCLPLISFVRQGARDRRSARRTSQVRATVTQIQVRAGALSSWWSVTVTYREPRTGRILTFHSPHLGLCPQQQVGDRILVHYDPAHPEHYQMDL